MRSKLMIAAKVMAGLLPFIAWASFMLIRSMDEYYHALRNPKLYPPPFSFPFWGDFVINYAVLSFLWAIGLGLSIS